MSIAGAPLRTRGASALGKFFGAKRGSAGEQAASQDEQAVAAVVAPVATTTEDGRPAVEWAALGLVPVAQCVPASPTFAAYEGQLSPVTAETVARLLGSEQKS